MPTEVQSACASNRMGQGHMRVIERLDSHRATEHNARAKRYVA